MKSLKEIHEMLDKLEKPLMYESAMSLFLEEGLNQVQIIAVVAHSECPTIYYNE